MKRILLTLASLTLLFYSYVYTQESARLRELKRKSETKLEALNLYHATRLDQKTSQLVRLNEVSLCDSFESTPTKLSLFDDQKIKIYVSERPDMSFEHVRPFETGEFSVRDGAIWVETINMLSGNNRKRTFPVLELNVFKNLSSINLESEVTTENCL